MHDFLLYMLTLKFIHEIPANERKQKITVSISDLAWNLHKKWQLLVTLGKQRKKTKKKIDNDCAALILVLFFFASSNRMYKTVQYTYAKLFLRH